MIEKQEPDVRFYNALCERDMKAIMVIWLAGDSLSQAYCQDRRPQAGWGEYLLSALLEAGKADADVSGADTLSRCCCGGAAETDAAVSPTRQGMGVVTEAPIPYYQARHREDCPFEQQLRYESGKLIVDNCSMGARSTRTFRSEGRWQDILTHLKQRDIVLMQFGHNDASSERPERYSSPEAYAENLRQFIEEARAAGARPVLVTPIAFRRQAAPFAGEAEDIRQRLPQYVAAMKRTAACTQTALIDLWTRTEALQAALTESACRQLYIHDGVHLTREGAMCFAALAAEQLLQLWEMSGKE